MLKNVAGGHKYANQQSYITRVNMYLSLDIILLMRGNGNYGNYGKVTEVILLKQNVCRRGESIKQIKAALTNGLEIIARHFIYPLEAL
jgi:hypothetical protein